MISLYLSLINSAAFSFVCAVREIVISGKNIHARIDARTSSKVFPYDFVILHTFYYVVLIVSYKSSIHFHPRLTLGFQTILYIVVSDTRGWIIFIHHLCVTVLHSLYAIYKVTSVLAYHFMWFSLHRFCPILLIMFP